MGNSSQGIGSFLVAKRTISTKEILADIKAGMDDAALMEKYWLSGKTLQSLFKKLVDTGVLRRTTWRKEPSCLKNPLQLRGNVRLVACLKQKHTMNARGAVSLQRSSRNRPSASGIFGNPDGPSDGRGC